jgi:hypothetical protein
MVLFKKGAINFFINLFCIFFVPFLLYPQDSGKGPEIFVSPRITLGYTFGSGLNYGFDIVLGLYSVDNFKFGVDFSYYMANTEQGHHSIKGFGIVGEMDYFSVKLGAGSVSRRWGLKNVNKAKAPGLMIDISAGVDPYRAPWIGFKSFIFNRNKWQFYDQPSYISVYTYFKSPDIEVFKEESLGEKK